MLLTDLFPFMRFGMFAEPVHNNVQTEYFYVVAVSHGKENLLDTESIGLSPSSFNYLARDNFYQKRSRVLLDDLGRAAGRVAGDTILLKRIEIDLPSAKKDTHTVYQYRIL